MDSVHLQIKNFIDTHPDVKYVEIVYSEASYFVLQIRCSDGYSEKMKACSRAIRYDELPFLMDALSMIYNECQSIE